MTNIDTLPDEIREHITVNPDGNHVLETIPDEYAEQIAMAMLGGNTDDLDAVRELYDSLLPIKAQEDSPDGFAAYFEFMHGPPLHSEGVKWVQNAYDAHDQGRGLAQEVHREGGKTTVFSKFFLSFRIGHEPHKTNAVIRINGEKANETTAAIAQIIEHDPRWKLVFPHVVPDHERGWGEKGYYVKRNDLDDGEWERIVTQSPPDPTFVGYGWESGSIPGSRFNGVCIVDDLIDDNVTSSGRKSKKIKTFVTDTLEYCKMAGSWEIWNFTPWTSTDVYAYIKSTGEYLHSKTPVMVEANAGDPGAELWPPMPLNPDYPEAGDIPLSGRYWIRYWPEMWPWERLASKYRKSKSLGFSRMMLLDLEAAKGRILKKEWLHRMSAADIDPSWPTIFGIDYTSTRDKTEARGKDLDYFCIAVLKAMPRGGLVLVDGYRARLSHGEALKRTAAMASQYPNLHLIGVESIGTGRNFYNDLLLLNDAIGRPLPLYEIKSHKTNKNIRFEKWLGPRFELARIWVVAEETAFISQFIEEWVSFDDAHDDTIDSVYMGAVAGEGFMPAKVERTEGRTNRRKRAKQDHPYAIGVWNG